MADRILCGGKFVAVEGGGTWPTPMDNPDGGLEWRLRYASVEQLQKDRMCAAEVVSAYRYLIMMTERDRRRVIRALRNAVKGRAPHE